MWRTIVTLVTLLVIMDGTDGAVGGSEEVDMTQVQQEENFDSQFFTENRFSGFQPRVGNFVNVDEDWREQRRKRKRHETGSVDIDTFSRMPMDEKLLVLFNKLSVVESKQTSLNMIMSPTREKVEILENCVNIHSSKLKMLAYKSIDLEARSRRNNLIFRGLADGFSENCTDLIVSFLNDEMQLDVSHDQIARAHRLGSLAKSRAKYAVTRRPLIVAFKDYSVTEKIMQAAKCLKGTFFRVEKDFPNEIADARKRLWPKLKAEKDKYPRSNVTIAYPAKLIRNGRIIYDEFPDWYDVLHVSRVRGFESDESCDENNAEQESKSSRRDTDDIVFRPWQGLRGLRERERENQNWAYQADTEGDSDSSVVLSTQPVLPQTTRNKVYTKAKTQATRPNSTKMTEKMKIAKDKKGIKKVPWTKDQHVLRKPSVAQKHQIESRKPSRTSSLPDLTRGRPKTRSTQRLTQQTQPISGEQQPHETSGSTIRSTTGMNEHSNAGSQANNDQ